MWVGGIIMQVLLIRHGTREQIATKGERKSRTGTVGSQAPGAAKSGDATMSLSAAGQFEVTQLRDMLKGRGLAPTLYLSSTSTHAYQTARLLSGRPFDKPADQIAAQAEDAANLPIYRLNSLTPGESWSLEAILEELRQARVTLQERDCVAIVGHHPRLSQILTRITGRHERAPRHAEAIVLEASSVLQLGAAQAQVLFRIPESDNNEEALRGKLQSKMQVSALLAGFTLTVLNELLISNRGAMSVPVPDVWSWDQVAVFGQQVGAVCFTAALALFVASIYIYDSLSMPSGFWQEPNADRRWAFVRQLRIMGEMLARHRRRQAAAAWDERSVLHEEMVWAWQWVFTPAVLLAVVGLIAVVASSANLPFFILGLGAILVAMAYYVATRPDLGAD